jgi:soluble lytic murein transglycosylase-like protein
MIDAPETILVLIMALALEVGVPSNIAIAIVKIENPNMDPYAVHHNKNGTVDRGIMQLNSSWYEDPNWYIPEHNIRAGLQHLKYIYDRIGNWKETIMRYNCGLNRKVIPASSIRYYNKVAAYL